jgi:hypothetical protein
MILLTQLKCRWNSTWRRRLSNDSGIAAVEFALTLPMTLLLFFGSLEASDLLTVKRRVANASNSLADLVSHDPTITAAQIQDSIIGVRRLLEPTDSSSLQVNISSVVVGPNPGDAVTVHWSIDHHGNAPYPADSVFTKLEDPTVVRNVASLIVVEMSYTYVSRLSGRVYQVPFEFNQTASRWPRRSPRVQLCATSDPATCTS